jgi:hypothetical protein
VLVISALTLTVWLDEPVLIDEGEIDKLASTGGSAALALALPAPNAAATRAQASHSRGERNAVMRPAPCARAPRASM